MSDESYAICPVRASDEDHRKSAALAEQRVKPNSHSQRIGSFAAGREILRNTAMKQAGQGSEDLIIDDPDHAPVFFLDDEPHRRKRSAIARFFTPKAITQHHRAVMERSSDALLEELKTTGRFCLDQASWQLAVEVAGEIVGITKGLTSEKKRKVGKRIEGFFAQTDLHTMKPLARFFKSKVVMIWAMAFFYLDVKPIIKARKKQPEDDIITHLIEEGYSDQAILIECMTYSGAGMATTREFIVMVAWHLFDNAPLRERFINGSEEEQIIILEEILRLEPVATLLYRRADDDTTDKLPEGIAPGTTYEIDMRAANTDESVTGRCPFTVDPDRARRMKVIGSYLSFGDGKHRCPGAQVALWETRIFIDRLFRIPGVRLVAPPKISWNDSLASYELRETYVVCDQL